MKVTVCTLARGRERHLSFLLNGLRRQTVQPLEFIVAHMQPAEFDGLAAPFPIRQIGVPGEALPLAKARNAAARAARGDLFIFLDVDCLPANGLVESYTSAASRDPSGCFMGETRYLGQADDGAAPFDELWERAAVHPARNFVSLFGEGVYPIGDHSEFWSLSFAMRADTFAASGGFDEAFVGYGGEDTDFAMRLARAGIGLRFVSGAQAVHQWHPVEKPPLAHFDDVVRNANLFRHKHGTLCMDYWLDQFEAAGYVTRATVDGTVKVLRRPTAEETAQARCDGTVRFS